VGRHRISNTKRAWKQRAQRLADDLERSEEAREALLKVRNVLLEDVRRLTRSLVTLQRELGTEAPTIPVQVAATSGPVHLLKPPETGQIPVQGPNGIRGSLPVHGTVSRPSQAHSQRHRPTWATG